MMTLTEMQYIVALADSLHFGQAAQRCGVSQSNLSMAIKKIETDLQSPLFERTKHKVLVTAFGEHLLPQLKAVVNRAEHISTIAQADQYQFSSPLKLGAPLSLGAYLFPRFAAQWRISNGTSQLHFIEDSPSRLMQKLTHCELDLLLATHASTDNQMLSQEIFSESYAVVLPKSHPLTQQNSLALPLLAKHSYLFLDDGEDVAQEIKQFFSPAQREAIKCNQLETLKQLLQIGVGFSILPESIAQAWCGASSQLQMCKLETDAKRKIYLVWRSSFTRTKMVDVVRQHLQKSLWSFTTSAEKEYSGHLVENDNW